MSLTGILRKVFGSVVRSKTRGARRRPVRRHQSAESQAVKGIARMAKKKL